MKDSANESRPSQPSEGLHVILGTGAVGCWTARALTDLGVPVRAVNRTGARPELMPDSVEVVSADAHDPARLVASAQGAAVVYQALNPEYHRWAEDFPALQRGALAAARAAGARYVSVENLYMYDSSQVMTDESRVGPVSGTGHLRARMARELADVRLVLATAGIDVAVVDVGTSMLRKAGVFRVSVQLMGR